MWLWLQLHVSNQIFPGTRAQRRSGCQERFAANISPPHPGLSDRCVALGQAALQVIGFEGVQRRISWVAFLCVSRQLKESNDKKNSCGHWTTILRYWKKSLLCWNLSGSIFRNDWGSWCCHTKTCNINFPLFLLRKKKICCCFLGNKNN